MVKYLCYAEVEHFQYACSMDTHLSTLLGLFILHLQLHSVSAAELLVLDGGSVTLEAAGHEDKRDLKYIRWKFHKTPVVTYIYTPTFKHVDVSTPYKGRVAFDNNTFSLLLKNLQKRDSGFYTAEREDDGKEIRTVGVYNLSVLEPVAAPTLTVVSNWSRNYSCNVTLNCTGLNVSLISRCNGTFCSQEGGVTSLSISLNTTTVSCNHSNPVSWRQTTMDLKPLCNSGVIQPDPPSWMTEIIIGVIFGVVIIIVVGIGWKLKSKVTDYNIPRDGPQSGVVESPGLTDNTYDEPVSQTKGNTAPPTTIYDTVQLPAPTSPAEAHQTPACPETIYAVVKKKDNSA